MAYRKFDTGTWQDPWFEDLSPKAKLAFIYLWTNEVCNPAGIYEISEKRIKFELGYGIDTIYSEIDTKIHWDHTRKTVWVKNFFRRQCQNSKFAIAALNSIKDDPYKLKTFIEYNRDVLESFTDKNGGLLVDLSVYHTDTIPIPYPTEQNRTEADTEQSRADTEASPPPCPHNEIIKIYHETLPELPPVKSWNESSQAKMKARWREDPERQALDWWRSFFSEQIRKSDFLMGRVKEFNATLDWIVGPQNFQKILNGQYVNNNNGRRPMTPKQAHNAEVLRRFVEEGEGDNGD